MNGKRPGSCTEKAVNAAVAALLQISKVAKKVYAEHGRAEAIAAVALVDKALSPGVQVTLLEQGRFLYHRDVDPTSDPMLCWCDFMLPGQSFLVTMLNERNGLALGRIKDNDGRLTAIAFETLADPPWLVVAENHYKQSGAQHYD